MYDHDSRKRLVSLDYDSILRETDMAVLVDFGEVEEWIPKSQIAEIEDGLITLYEWIAIEKGLV